MIDNYRSASDRICHLLYTNHGDDRSMPREQLRYLLNDVQRIAARACELIDQEIIRELKDLRRAMPEHGFTTKPPARQPATLDDIL